MIDLLEAEPSNYAEASQKQVWQDAMGEEYSSIIKNDVWDVVPGLHGSMSLDPSGYSK